MSAPSAAEIRSDRQAIAGHVGRRIRRLRRGPELSQEWVADQAQIHRTQISLIEHGQRTMLIPTFVKLAGALGVSPCELLGGLAWEPGGSRPGRFTYGGDGQR